MVVPLEGPDNVPAARRSREPRQGDDHQWCLPVGGLRIIRNVQLSDAAARLVIWPTDKFIRRVTAIITIITTITIINRTVPMEASEASFAASPFPILTMPRTRSTKPLKGATPASGP